MSFYEDMSAIFQMHHEENSGKVRIHAQRTWLWFHPRGVQVSPNGLYWNNGMLERWKIGSKNEKYLDS